MARGEQWPAQSARSGGRALGAPLPVYAALRDTQVQGAAGNMEPGKLSRTARQATGWRHRKGVTDRTLAKRNGTQE